jgi:nuclear pore complex protein Nup93
MVIQFAKQWSVSDPADCLHYVYMFGLFGLPLDAAKPSPLYSKEYTKLAHQLVIEIVLATSRYGELLGQYSADGVTRIPGHVHKHAALIHLTSEQDFIDRIVLACAHETQQQGKLQDAIYLNHLAGEYQKVLELLNAFIGEKLLLHSLMEMDDAIKPMPVEAMTDTNLPQLNLQADPVDVLEEILKYYLSKPSTASKISKETEKTARTLGQLYRFRSLIEQGKQEAALSVLYSLKLIPMSAGMAEIQRQADNFGELHESIARVVPHIMLMAANALYHLFKAWSTRRTGLADAARETRLSDLRVRCKALLMFAGLIQYRIPGDVFAKLNRIDVMMG